MSRAQSPTPTPPLTRKGDVVEDHFGIKVADPYRWLEDADSEETKAWVKAQNEVTFKYLRGIPQWDRIRRRLEELYTYERYGIPVVSGKHLVYTHNTGTQNQSVYFVSDLDGANPRVLLDPNGLSKDGTVAVSSTSVSNDGKLFAYSLSTGGSDWQEWHVRDIATGKDLPDVIPWAKFSGASWNKGNNGFYYGAFDVPKDGRALQGVNYYQKIYFHRLGTPVADDVLIHQDPDHKEYMFEVNETEDGRYLVLTQSEGTRPENRVFVRDLHDMSGPFTPIFDKFDASYQSLANDGPTFYFLTDKDAPLKRIIAVDVRHPDSANWRVVVPEAKDSLQGANVFGDSIIASYLKDAHQVVRRYDLAGNSHGEIALPGLGTASGFGGMRKDRETFFSYTDFTTPASIYRLDVGSAHVAPFRRLALRFDPSQFESRQVFYPSKDGTKIPMFITHKKGIALNGENPTLLYGYGGFNIAITPFFNARTLQWMEMGGVLAVANLRGGSEYGRAWYDAGRLKNKQNVFDDFIAAAEFLIADKITSTPKLAIEGGSNGGLLVGACETQRPDLFGVCIPEVGVMDMLRFDKFTIGYAWKSDYGDPGVEADFQTLLKYSPLHNIRPGTVYPPTLIFTGDHDDRVVPAHSFKYAATLQAAQAGSAPILIRIETSAGHGAGKPISKILDEGSDLTAFLVKNLNFAIP